MKKKIELLIKRTERQLESEKNLKSKWYKGRHNHMRKTIDNLNEILGIDDKCMIGINCPYLD